MGNIIYSEYDRPGIDGKPFSITFEDFPYEVYFKREWAKGALLRMIEGCIEDERMEELLEKIVNEDIWK